jgi:hypothetical protein
MNTYTEYFVFIDGKFKCSFNQYAFNSMKSIFKFPYKIYELKNMPTVLLQNGFSIEKIDEITEYDIINKFSGRDITKSILLIN